MGKPAVSKTGLKQLIGEADKLKKQTDAHVKDCEKFLSGKANGVSKQRGKDLYAKSVELKQSIDATIGAVQKLNRADEQGSVAKNYDKQRDEEIVRLQRLAQCIEPIVEKLRPDEVEDAFLRAEKERIGHQSPGEDTFYEESLNEEASEDDEENGNGENKGEPDDLDEEDDDISEEATDEEEQEDEEVRSEKDAPTSMETTINIQYEAMSDYDPDRKDELRLRRGDVVTLVHVREDGWWMCESSDGQQGLVPSTYMKEYDKYKSLRSTDTADSSARDPPQPNDLASWSGLNKSLHESGVTDVLHAWGAVPSGFRPPTLARLYADGLTFRMQNYLTPKLSTSNLFYKDLFYQFTSERIRARTARVQKMVTLVGCRQVPLPGDGTEVKARWARVCLFNGTEVLSNIHSVRALAVDRDGMSWTFSSRLQDVMHTVEHGEVFLRSVGATKNLGLLIELSVTFVKLKTGQQFELSCGWSHVPLLNEDGSQVANKQFELILNGGTPYEKGVEVDPTIGRRPTSKFKSLISRQRQPLITVRVGNPNKEQKEQLDLLPDALVSNACYLQHISLYRAMLAETLLHDKADVLSAEMTFKPFLVHFPSAVEQPDLMDVLRSSWIDKLQTSRHLNKYGVCLHPVRTVCLMCLDITPAGYSDASAKRDFFLQPQLTTAPPRFSRPLTTPLTTICSYSYGSEILQDLNVMTWQLQQVFMEWVYPLMHLHVLTDYVHDNGASEQARQLVIDKSLQLISSKKSTLASLLSPDIAFEPIDMSELAYSIIGPYCLHLTAAND